MKKDFDDKEKMAYIFDGRCLLLLTFFLLLLLLFGLGILLLLCHPFGLLASRKETCMFFFFKSSY